VIRDPISLHRNSGADLVAGADGASRYRGSAGQDIGDDPSVLIGCGAGVAFPPLIQGILVEEACQIFKTGYFPQTDFFIGGGRQQGVVGTEVIGFIIAGQVIRSRRRPLSLVDIPDQTPRPRLMDAFLLFS
jgi:hypothetical protein